MKIGEIKIEALKLMHLISEDVEMENLADLYNDVNTGDLVSKMDGSINRCLSLLAERQTLPSKLHLINLSNAEINGNTLNYSLSENIDDYLNLEKVTATRDGVFLGEVDFYIEGDDKLIITDYVSNTLYSCTYKPQVEFVTSGSDSDELDIPKNIAVFVPYFVKGDLFREDEPSEAGESMNYFEQSILTLHKVKQGQNTRIRQSFCINNLLN